MYKLNKGVFPIFVLYGLVCLTILGAFKHTVDGTWGELPTSVITAYLSVIIIDGALTVRAYNNRRAIGQAKGSAELASPVDKYGYLKEIDWQVVARLEHEHGYDHLPESLAACRKYECIQTWLDDMPLDEAIPELMRLVTTGIFTTNDLRKLTGIAVEEVMDTVVDEHGRSIFQKDSGGRYLNELRAMPTEPSRNDLDRQQSEWHSFSASCLCKKEIEQRLKLSHSRGTIIVMPDFTPENRGYLDIAQAPHTKKTCNSYIPDDTNRA